MEDLKPCPFCGEDTAVQQTSNTVYCTNCSSAASMAVWNTRALAEPAKVDDLEHHFGQIEKLLAEFEHDPKTAFECVGEYMGTVLHSCNLTPPGLTQAETIWIWEFEDHEGATRNVWSKVKPAFHRDISNLREVAILSKGEF